jgi:integrase
MRVKIVGIKQYTSNGKVYRYWRRKGAPLTPIDPRLKGAALAAEIARLEAIYITNKPLPGTLRLLVVEYKRNSNHFRSLRPRTVLDYERVFKWLGSAMDCPVIEITKPEIARTRDCARDQHEPKFANQVVTVLKMVFAYGVEQGFARENPALNIAKAKGGNKRPNRPCTPAEANALIDFAPKPLRPVIAIALYTGLRLGDVVALKRTAIQGDWMETEQSKTRKLVRAYIPADLKRILGAIEYDSRIAATTACVKDDKRPWRYEGVKTAFQRHRDALEAQGLIGPGVTFHGLRHTVSTVLAEAGYMEGEVAHLLGHGPKSISGHYMRSAQHRALLQDMGETIERAYREARGNVVRMDCAREV